MIPRTTKSTATDAQQEQDRNKENRGYIFNSERDEITNTKRQWIL